MVGCHVDVILQSIKFTSFTMHDGQFEFLKIPFGLCNISAVFSHFILCFCDLLSNGTLILYMDDLMIPYRIEVENLEKLKSVLQFASTYGLELNFRKCQFLQRKIEFLIRIIENNTIAPSPTKIKAVLNFPEPTNLKQLQSYLVSRATFESLYPTMLQYMLQYCVNLLHFYPFWAVAASRSRDLKTFTFYCSCSAYFYTRIRTRGSH